MRENPSFRSPACGGFTLIEILVALFVMLIGISSAFALFAAAAAMHKRASDQFNAAVLAESIFSEIESRLTTGVKLSQLERSGATFPGFENYKYDVRLVSFDDDEEEIYVRLTIYYLQRGRARPQEFETVIIRHLPFKGRDPYSGGD